MSIKGNEKSFESSLASERLLGIVYILFLIIAIATTIDAGTRGVASVMDNGELDYFNPTELRAVLFFNIPDLAFSSQSFTSSSDKASLSSLERG